MRRRRTAARLARRWRLALTTCWLVTAVACLALAGAARQVNNNKLGNSSWALPLAATALAAGFALIDAPGALTVSALATIALAGYAAAAITAGTFGGAGYLLALAVGAAAFTSAVALSGRARHAAGPERP